MIQEIDIDNFLKDRGKYTLLDVRSPGEYEQGHIPGAFNLPLLDDEERAQVGTTYKESGREEAILLGFDLTGHKWCGFIEKALELAPDKKVSVYCARGGMRSGIMAWALDLYGFDVSKIKGGYKRYRNWALEQFQEEYPFIILGGLTGTHKTEILLEMEKKGEQIIDLEGLARHQGSAFGSMNKMTQPTQQQFENELAIRLHDMSRERQIWIENESRTIGRRVIPPFVWKQKQNSVVIELQIPDQQRVDFLVEEYGSLDKKFLIEKTRKITKRLGPQHAQHAIEAIEEDRMADFIRTVLVYYDKAYRHGMNKRESVQVFTLNMDYENASVSADKLIKISHSIENTLMKL